MAGFTADWVSFVMTGLGTLFLFGELLVNRKGIFGIIGIGFISIYFLSFLNPQTFIMVMVIYLAGLVLIIVDGKLINDGTLGTLGAVCMMVAVGITSPNWIAGLYGIIGVLVGAFSSLLFLKVFKRRDMWTKLTLVDRLTEDKGYSTMNVSYTSLINKQGITVTDMRPVGTIKVADKEYSAITNGQWIEKNTAVEIIKVDGTKILVNKV